MPDTVSVEEIRAQGDPIPLREGAAPSRQEASINIPRLLIVFALVSGVLVRLIQYVGNRSLWLDEALLVPDIVERSFAEILNPQSWAVTPPGFLLLEKASVVLIGNHELALRLFPLLAGVGAVLVSLPVARRYLSPGAVPIALWLVALSPFLVYYSSELKQYSSDAFISLLLFWGAAEIHAGGASRRKVLGWALGGTLAIFVSQTAVFVLGGATLGLLLSLARRNDRDSVRRLLVPAAGWTLLFGAAYLLVLRGADTTGYMRTFWSSGFMPLPPRSLADWAWFPETFERIFKDPLGVIGDTQIKNNFYQAAAGMAAFGAGSLWMWSSRRDEFLILSLPILLALGASGLRLYPFGGDWLTGGRVILFLAPSFFLLMGEGAHRIRQQMPGIGAAVVLLLIAPSAAYALIAVPNGRVEVKPLLTEVAEQWRPGDALYVHYELNPAVRYYAPRYGFPSGSFRPGRCARFEPVRYLQDLDQVSGSNRVWILFGTGRGARGFDEKGLMLDYLAHLGTQVGQLESQGASLHLFEMQRAEANGKPYEVTLRPPEYLATEDCALWN